MAELQSNRTPDRYKIALGAFAAIWCAAAVLVLSRSELQSPLPLVALAVGFIAYWLLRLRLGRQV